MSDKLFGTDGVRGIANSELSPTLAFNLGVAAARVLGQSHAPAFVIGRDTRISGTMLEAALSAGICSMGGKVVNLGVVPTPAVARIARTGDFDSGIVISASHNAFADNGIKFFGHDGYKLDDEIEDQIAACVALAAGLRGPSGAAIGTIRHDPGLRHLYSDYIRDTMGSVRLDNMKVVLDAANGANCVLAPGVFAELGADIVSINCAPDGVNINAHCGSLHPHQMLARTVAEGADLGMAFDGDADRVMLSDENGRLVDGDRVMLLVGKHLASREKLHGRTVVGTIMSNMGLEVALRESSVTLIRAAVGDRYVSEIMRREGFVLGGEKSGHVIFGHLSTTGDGLLTALQVIRVMRETGRPLSALADQMQEYPQVLLGVRVTDRNGWREDPDIRKAIAAAEAVLSGCGRINVRASGTEKLVRVMTEGPDHKEIDAIAREVAALVEKKFGAAAVS
ncbi:MAG: phosphoglucosamine mutase [Capsulimonadaceae bacterium]